MRLQKEGLLRKISNVGYFVQKPDYFDYQQIFQVRKCVEPYVFSHIFEKLTEDDIRQLERISGDIEKAVNNGDWLEALDQDIAFHLAFVSKYQNKYLEELYLMIRNRYKNFTIKNLSAMPVGDLVGNGDHIALIKAIRGRDMNAALKELNAHIDVAYERMTKRCFPAML